MKLQEAPQIKLPNPKRVRACEYQTAKVIAKATAHDKAFHAEDTRQALEDLIDIGIKETRILSRGQMKEEAQEITRAFLHMAKTSFLWIRPATTYKSNSHNPQRQLTSLLDHLYSKYPRPAFLDCAFFEHNDKNLDVFLHIAQGGNIRTLKSFQPKFTKTQAHFFHTTPAGYDMAHAIMRAEALSYQVEPRILQALMPINFEPHTSELRRKFFEFLGKQNMVNPDQIHPLWDYIRANQTHRNPDGTTTPFSFKGRTINSLLQKMEKWHGDLSRAKANKNRTWEPTNIPNFEHPNPQEKPVEWSITQICTEKELHAEGKALHHCVYSYTEACIMGTCSIWSLKSHDPLSGVKTREATIEIRGKVISQARRSYNGALKPTEKAFLALWAQKAQLSLGRYI